MRPSRVTFCSVACSKRKDDWARLMHQQMWRAMGHYPLGICMAMETPTRVNTLTSLMENVGNSSNNIEHHRTTYLPIYLSIE